MEMYPCTHRRSTTRAVVADPIGKRRLVQLSGRETEKGQNAIGVAGCQSNAVHCEKKLGCDKSGSLVAIREGVIASQAKAIGCSQGGDVRLAMGRQIEGAGEGRVECACVPYAGKTAMLGKLLVMYCKNYGSFDPNPIAHLA